MSRGIFRSDGTSGERFFRWRGGDVSRLEGLADAVFALALTLLVVRLEVPQTFAEVEFALMRAPVYIACFALFLWIWYCHYQFHRRYGLDGPLTVALDGALLFVVLMFALPLRFLADMLYMSFAGAANVAIDAAGHPVLAADGTPVPIFEAQSEEVPVLMLFYSGGFALLFALLALQTAVALGRRELLQLDELEVAVSRGTIRAHLLSMGIGVLSFLIALFAGAWASLAGPVFVLMGPAHGVLGYFQGRRYERLERQLGAHSTHPK